MTKSALQYVVNEMALFFAPLGRLSPVGTKDLMAEIGWDWPDDATLDATSVVTAIGDWTSALMKLNADSGSVEYIGAIKAAAEVGHAVKELRNNLPNPQDFTGSARDKLRILEENKELLPKRLLAFLTVGYLKSRLPGVLAFLQLIGVVSVIRVPPAESSPAFDDVDLTWANLSRLISAPDQLLADLYGWGQSKLRNEDLLAGLKSMALGLGLPATITPTPVRIARAMAKALGVDVAATEPGYQVEIPFLQTYSEDVGAAELGLKVVCIPDPKNPGEGVRGIAVFPYATGQTQTSATITEELRMETSGSFDADFAITLLPGRRTELLEGLFAGGSIDMALGVNLALERKDSRFIVFGSNDGSRFEYSKLGVMFGFKGSPEDLDCFVEMSLTTASIILCGSDGDSFLGRLLPKEPLIVPIDITLGLSNKRRFYIGSSGGFELTIPLHFSCGPIKVESAYLALGLSNAHQLEVSVRIGLSACAEMGPVNATIQRIGVKSILSFPAGRRGNLGSADLDIGFLPPTGAGLSVDAGVIVGGGYLEFNNEEKSYAGILALQASQIGLTAIALITTKMPDGSKDFSLLISICTTFEPPIQLSYGFTLSGVGGLVGINRGLEVEALRVGIKNRTLDSILFPDPSTIIVNAAKILSDMRAVFPPRKGRFVVGPMVKIGWGTPNIIVADIGVFIELPSPIRIALLGQLEAILPEESNAIVLIHMDVLGVLDLEKRELTFQASLYDSRLLTYPMYGDSAFLLSWGESPQFAMSLGGFHPKFAPPAPPTVFANLKRMTICIDAGSKLQLACTSYQALTPNTLQFGARVDLYASEGGAKIKGYLGFDTLVYFSPFSFEVWMGAGVEVEYKGIELASVDLSVMLTGPSPWVARGKAKIEVLHCSKTVGFCKTWGEKRGNTLPEFDPWEKLQEALGEPGCWGAVLPDRTSVVESLRVEKNAASMVIVVHPFGQLEVRQKVVPLGMQLSRASNAPIAGHDRFDITSMKIGGKELGLTPVEESFARGQWEELGDRALSVPAFERMKAGVSANCDSTEACGDVESMRFEYESSAIGPDGVLVQPEDENEGARLKWEDAKQFVRNLARQNAAWRAGPQKRYSKTRSPAQVRLREEGYCIARASDLQRADIPLQGNQDNRGMTRTLADQLLKAERDRHPEMVEELIVVSESEVAA